MATTIDKINIDGTDYNIIDTKNTAGATNSESKLYIVGTTDQKDGEQSYSDTEVYTEAGELNATSMCVAEHGQIKYDSTNKCIRFVIV